MQANEARGVLHKHGSAKVLIFREICSRLRASLATHSPANRRSHGSCSLQRQRCESLAASGGLDHAISGNQEFLERPKDGSMIWRPLVRSLFSNCLRADPSNPDFA